MMICLDRLCSYHPKLSGRIRHARPGTRNQEPGTRNQEPGTRNSVGAPLRGKRFLILDDDLFSLETMCDLLKSCGAEVYAFDQGGLAIKWLETHLSDCDGVLTDIRMPIMDGFAVARHIREELGLTQLPIIAVTGERMEKHASKETTGFFNETITKPFQPETLIESLKKHV